MTLQTDITSNLLREMGEASKYNVTCYLAGPIGKVHLTEAKSWRNGLKPRLNEIGIGYIDPLDKYGGTRKIRTMLQRYDRDGKIDKIRELVNENIFHQDMDCVFFTTFTIAYVPALDVGEEICGTYGEITMARYLNKPVYIVTNRSLKPNNLPKWAIGCSTRVFESFDELLGYLMATYGEE